MTDLLLVGDLHLGREPRRLSGALAELGLRPQQLGARAAWQATVTHAVQHRVRAVLLAGDVVDDADDRFEGYAALHDGAQQLSQAGIPLVAVAGNHDAHVLPRLVRELPGVTLLGAGGRWQRWSVPGTGPAVDLVGWSFPQAHVSTDPTSSPQLASLLAAPSSADRTYGLLHGDLDAATSRYAPLNTGHLRSFPVDGWFLGHLHTPTLRAGPGPHLGYLGSLTGLDPSEVGLHGPWALSPATGQLQQLPLAPVRWCSLALDATHLHHADDLPAALARALAQHAQDDPTLQAPGLQALVLRVTLIGQVPPAQAQALQAALSTTPQPLAALGRVPVLLDRVRSALVPTPNLQDLARHDSPAGRLARRLLTVQQGGDDPLLHALPNPVRRWIPDHLLPDHPPPAPRDQVAAALTQALAAVLAHHTGAAPAAHHGGAA